MHRLHRRALSALPFILLVACGHKSTPTGLGGAKVFVQESGDLSKAAEVKTVTVTITGATIATPITQTLVSGTGGTFSGSFTNLPSSPPSQPHYFFGAAYDAGHTLLFQGGVYAAVEAGTATAVLLTLVEVNPTPSYSHAPPVIESVVSSSLTVETLGQLVLSASAYDPQSEPLNYAWSATPVGGTGSVGTFSPGATGPMTNGVVNTDWTAPTSGGQLKIALTVTENGTAAQLPNLSETVSFTITVTPSTSGSVQVTVSFDDDPVVTDVAVSNTRPTWGQTIQLTFTGEDVDPGDIVFYQWSNAFPLCTVAQLQLEAGTPATSTTAAVPPTPQECDCFTTASGSPVLDSSGNCTGPTGTLATNAPVYLTLPPPNIWGNGTEYAYVSLSDYSVDTSVTATCTESSDCPGDPNNNSNGVDSNGNPVPNLDELCLPVVTGTATVNRCAWPRGGSTSGAIGFDIETSNLLQLLPVVTSSLMNGAPPAAQGSSDFGQSDYFNAAVSLQIVAQSGNTLPAGSTDYIYYSNWRASNDGTISISGAENTATWYPGSCQATPSTATVTLTDSANSALSIDYTFMINTCAPKSCLATQQLDENQNHSLPGNSWGYPIDPDGTGPNPPFYVECDFSRNGGGWALVATLGPNHAVLATDTMLSNTADAEASMTMSGPQGTFGSYVTYGINAPDYSHYDLRLFNAYGNQHTFRVESVDVTLATPEASAQFAFFQPNSSCASGACPPGFAGGNWIGSTIASNYQLLNYGAGYTGSGENTTWLNPVPNAWPASLSTSGLGMFGYSNTTLPQNCTSTSCSCTNGGQTTQCLGSPGFIESGLAGVPSADTGLEDGVAYQKSGRLLNVWLRDDADATIDQP